jgi:hypothetical protein
LEKEKVSLSLIEPNKLKKWFKNILFDFNKLYN